MEHLEIKAGQQLNYDSIKALAAQKSLRERVKANDTFYIPTPQLGEIEPLLNENKITYKKTAHPTYNLTMFTVLN